MSHAASLHIRLRTALRFPLCESLSRLIYELFSLRPIHAHHLALILACIPTTRQIPSMVPKYGYGKNGVVSREEANLTYSIIYLVFDVKLLHCSSSARWLSEQFRGVVSGKLE